jgi:hypothetical protein
MVERCQGISVFTGIGERSREGHELWADMQKSNVLGRTALVFRQMNEPPGARWRVVFTALTVAAPLPLGVTDGRAELIFFRQAAGCRRRLRGTARVTDADARCSRENRGPRRLPHPPTSSAKTVLPVWGNRVRRSRLAGQGAR